MKKLPTLLAFAFLTCAAMAQETEAPKPQFDKAKAEKAALPMPNPYDKLLAIEETVGESKIDWAALADNIAVDVDPNKIESKQDAAMALGVKIADGIVAIKAQNAEKLNRSADQLESLGKKLGATDDDLKRSRQVRDLANRGEWLMVFLELGFLQADIMQKLSSPENQADRTLVIASGWLQGARYASALIGQNYTPALSNILREPLLAGELNKQVSALGGDAGPSAKVQAISKAVAEAYPIVNISLDASISKEDVAKLKSISDTAVEAVTAD
ncbi:MAG: hypothetical protein JHC52_05730 [Chthoniobacterales bacterium]|jgi:hypothetical protein|nr:hypothetical protein [Chthoniobacterales bacterium]